MPPRRSTGQDVDYQVSDSDLDELTDEEDEDDKTGVGILAGALSKPRHMSLSCKQLHDMSSRALRDASCESDLSSRPRHISIASQASPQFVVVR